MPVQLICPGCNCELTASDEIVGQMASCPQCKTQFHVADERNGDGGNTAPGTPPPPPAKTPAKAPSETSPKAPRRAGSVAPGLKNVTARGKSAADPPSVARSAARGSSAPAKSLSPPTRSSDPPVQPARRQPKQAKFITADAASTKVHLGADGRLPELLLEEAATKEKAVEESSSGTSPLLLVVLAISVVSSVVLILFDTSASRSESLTKQEARIELKENYIGEPSVDAELEPYQLLIRKALNARDFAAERRQYKKVLDLLHAERNNKYDSLTDSPASDEDLEKLLITLRRE